MGLLSGIKKVFKKIKKVFKKVAGKIFGGKFGKVLMLGVALLTGGAGLVGLQSAFASGGMGALVKQGVSNLISSAVGTLTAPLKLITKGISAVGGTLGADGLAQFGNSLTSGLENFSDKLISGSDNLLGTTSASGADVTGKSIAKDFYNDKDALGADAATNIADRKVANVETLADETAIAADEAALGGDADIGKAVNAKNMVADAVPEVASSATKPKGKLLSRGLGFIEDHPETTKIVGSMLSSAFSEPDETYEDRYKAMAEYENKYGLQNMNLDDVNFGYENRNPNAQARGGELNTAAQYAQARTGQLVPTPPPGQQYQTTQPVAPVQGMLASARYQYGAQAA